MSANLTSINGYYNVDCNQLFEKQNAYAVYASNVLSQAVVPGTNQLITFTNPIANVLSNITLNENKNVFTLTSRGVYLIDLNISVDLAATAGAQGIVNLFVNDQIQFGDVGYSNATVVLSSVKLTCKSFVSQTSDTPTTISFQLVSLNAPMTFRYAQLSITKIGSI